jgi:hypothetical protein
MPLGTIPAIDANICGNWTEQDVNLYNKLDFYLATMQVQRRKTWTTWSRFFGKVRWTPNMGDTMRSVTKEPSPHLRQFAFPNPITQAPRKDVLDVRERRTDEVVYRHRFESPVMNFLPSFRDFLNDHVKVHGNDIMEKQERFEDIFYRGRVFHNSPKVWITGRAAGELVDAPMGVGNINGTDGKTTNWLQAMTAQLGAEGGLSIPELLKALTVVENDLRLPAFSGNGLPTENKGMQDKYVLVCSSEAFNQFSLDPFLLENKNQTLDIIGGRFYGPIGGRISVIIEDMPMRMRADGSFPDPEVREVNPAAYNIGESTPNPVYTDLTETNGSPYEWAFLVGAEGYDVIEVGPPPSEFASGKLPPGFGKMFWNGEVQITKNILIPCPTENGIEWVPNQYGEYLQFISQVTYGMRARQRRNIVPILLKRKRGL